MTKHCSNCVYYMSGNPPVCNALHTPIAGETDCVDWESSESRSGCLTPDGLYLRERLDQGQVPIAEIIQRQRSEQVERWREAFERGDPFGDLRQSQVNQSFGYEIQESIEARRAAIARDTQRRADEAIAPIAFTFRVDRDRDSYTFVNCVFENGREVARDLQRRADVAIALSELQAICDRHLNPFRDGQELHARSQSTGRIIEFIAIATPNGLKWQYQGAVIID